MRKWRKIALTSALMLSLTSCSDLLNMLGITSNANAHIFDNLKFEDATFTYDGEEHSLEVVGELPEGVSVEYTNNDHILAGEYEVTATFVDATGKYKLPDEMKATLTIKKAKYDMSHISFTDTSVFYNGQEQVMEISGELPDGVTVEYLNNENHVNVGEYNVVAVFSHQNPNYEAIDPMEAKLKILKAQYDMSNIRFSDKEFTYDGNKHSLAIEGELPSSLLVSYKNNGQIESGEYIVEASFINLSNNYEEVGSLYATIKINKADYDLSAVKFHDKSVQFDGNDHGIEITGTLPEGVTVSYEDNAHSQIGEYIVTANFFGDEINHNKIPSKTAKLTITEKIYYVLNYDVDLEVGYNQRVGMILYKDNSAVKSGDKINNKYHLLENNENSWFGSLEYDGETTVKFKFLTYYYYGENEGTVKYVESQWHNVNITGTINETYNWTGTLPKVYEDYIVFGNFGANNELKDIALRKRANNTYELKKLELYEGNKFKIHTTGDAWFSYNSLKNNEEFLETDAEGNIVFSEAGVYNVIYGNPENGKYLLVERYDPNAVDLDSWTILIYLCGADLESGSGLAGSDLSEIKSVSNQPDDVNIVVEAGGASSWQSPYSTLIDKSKLNRLHLENKSFINDEKITKASMGKASTLQEFIEYGVTEYPAENTGLILWNHGGALRGVCYDENFSSDSLTDDEVVTAVSNAYANTGTEKLTWIGYDACLMNVQDVAEFNSPYFDYMIASEESEAGEGWDYDTWIDDVYAGKSTETILKTICDGFIADNGGVNASGYSYWGYYYAADQTLSYLNLSYMSDYKAAWEAMATELLTIVASKGKTGFNNIIKKVKYFAGSDYDYYCIFDVYHFLEKLDETAAYRPSDEVMENVFTAFNNLVEYSTSQVDGAKDAHGLAMYYIAGTGYSQSSYATAQYSSFTNWNQLSRTYGGSINSTYSA